jgi:hydroxymethylglutaryl-CoA lyase
VTAVEILETSPRDGLQNEDAHMATHAKVELIARAVRAGARRVEVTSFVNPARVPQMADAEAVMSALPRLDGVRYAGLVANERGLDRALAAGVDEINVVVVASDTFCRVNQGTDTADAARLAGVLVDGAKSAGVFAAVTVAAAFGCPFEGEVPLARLREVLARVIDASPDELALADTIGVAVPSEVTARVGLAAESAPKTSLRLHLHDTRHTGVANAVAGLTAGVTAFDASIGGAGGCPFAPGAAGNVATEDLAYLFSRMGLETGLDLEELTGAVGWLEKELGHNLPGAIARAGGFPVPHRVEQDEREVR